MDSKYSISKPKEVLSSDYLGTFLVRQNANQYACKKKTDTEKWWAIGMIANEGTYWHPLIVSNTKTYCYSYSDNYNNGNPLSDKTASFDYNGTTYYASFGAYGSNTVVPTNASIPVYSETKSSDISHMAQILLGLHLQNGGTLPSGEDSSGNYQKVDYLRINWENKSESLKTPIDKGNLNKMDKAIADLCANLDIAHTESEVKKLDKSSANKLFSETPTWDAETGILTFKFFDGTSFNVDFNVEKIPVSFSMDSNGVITMTTDDGTEWTADVSKLIQDYTFNNGPRISFTKTKKEDGYDVSADIVKGSITEEYLEKNYLASIISNVNASNSNAANAATSATNAANDAKLAQSYAIGRSGIRDGEDTDNAKYYSEQASKAKQELLNSMNIAGRGLTVEYDADSQRNVFALARECVQITDWNTQFYTGFYGSSVSANGVPSDAVNYGTAFFGIVLQATDSANRSSVVYQTGIVYKNSRTDFSGIKKYERVYAQGQWSSWVELQFTDTVYDDTEVKESISAQSTEITDIKMLGWSVPKECPIQNEVNGNQFVQKVGRVDLGSLDWRYDAASGHERFKSTNALSLIRLPESNAVPANIYTNGYATNSANDIYTHKNDKSISMGVGNTLSVYDTSYTDATTFKEAMQGQYLYYELATPITTTIDGNEIGETVSDVQKYVRKETTVNLLNLTRQTTTIAGITFTKNNDGTYTLSGTATDQIIFVVTRNIEVPKISLLVECKGASTETYTYGLCIEGEPDKYFEVADGVNKLILPGTYDFLYIVVRSGITIPDNTIIKPMLTTNLSATYEDFVQYTGDSGSLNGDVADLRENVDNLVELGEDITDTTISHKAGWLKKVIDGVSSKVFAFAHAKTVYSDFTNKLTLEDKVKTKKIQIFADATADYYREIEPIAGDVSILTPPIVVNGSENSYDPSGGESISGENYTYSQKNDTTLDILDSLISSAQTTSGIKVNPRDSTSFGGGYYRVTGTATADVTIPLYSVSNPSSDALWFAGNISPSMSANTFYYLISDTAGNSVEIGTDEAKTGSVKLGTHSGTVTVSLVVKSGTKVTLNAVVRGGYKKQYTFYDVGSQKYSDKIDNVLDAVLDVKNTANFSHNIPRNVPKDLTSYITDGTFYKRLNGTDGFELFEDIYVGDYIKMSRAITCPGSTNGTAGSQYVTIAGLDTMMYNGEDGKYVNYHHAVMVPGQGFGGTQHFGRHAMNATNTTKGGYVASVMDQSVLGAVATEGSTAGGATINQQLYEEFGSHLKTTDEVLSTSINATGINRFGTADGCSNNWGWTMRQAVLMSEVEVYGCTIWSSSGYDTGNAKMQLPLFAHSRSAMNNRTAWYWLKDVASSTRFCVCYNHGGASTNNAESTRSYVRPRFIIAA